METIAAYSIQFTLKAYVLGVFEHAEDNAVAYENAAAAAAYACPI